MNKKLGNFVKVRQFEGNNGGVRNQFEIETDKGIVFQSYNSMIAFKSGTVFKSGTKIFLDRNKWDYSTTTGKYRNIFLGEDRRTTEKKIKAGIYELADLN